VTQQLEQRQVITTTRTTIGDDYNHDDYNGGRQLRQLYGCDDVFFINLISGYLTGVNPQLSCGLSQTRSFPNRGPAAGLCLEDDQLTFKKLQISTLTRERVNITTRLAENSNRATWDKTEVIGI
jgi:hypothetical protein